MTPEELRAVLTAQRVPFSERPIQDGIQFRCGPGEIFSLYHTGRLVCQGKQTELSIRVREADGGKISVGIDPPAIEGEAVLSEAQRETEPDVSASLTLDVTNIDGNARKDYLRGVQRFAKELRDETFRLEAADRQTAGPPEVTSRMVNDAGLLLRRGYRKPQRSILFVVLRIVSYVATIATGWAANAMFYSGANGRPNILPFVICFLTAVLTALPSLIKE